MEISKSVRKRKLKEIRKKLSDIADVLESIYKEDERYLEISDTEKNESFEQLEYTSDTIASAVMAVQSAIFLVDAATESDPSDPQP
jgi:hypothetical protein